MPTYDFKNLKTGEVETKFMSIASMEEYIKDPNIHDLENDIIEKIGLKVFIKNNKNNKGQITFEYKSLDQLNKIIEVIKNNY